MKSLSFIASNLRRGLLTGVGLLLGLSAFAAQAEVILFNTSYVPPGSGAPSTSGWVDSSGKTWNYIPTWNPYSTGSRVLKTSTGSDSQIQWSTTERFAWYGTNGTTSGTLGYPGLVSQYGLYLGTASTTLYSHAEVTLTGLNSGASYSLTFYGARTTGATADAMLAFEINGEDAGELFLASGTHEAELFVQQVTASANGELVIGVSLPTGYSIGYLNAVKLEAIPEPGTVAILGAGALVPFLLKRRFH